ncbi:type II secretion system major pseudopilin GspG [Planctomycetales bacterium ZRK34]|nr:type II secretion system major pseudopilin GspG [Planctomycetales bacterium ZRK34]
MRRHDFRGQSFRGRGFSLVEIMVVVVIIGLLAGAVAIKVGDYVETARSTRTKSDIATIVGAIETYHAQHGVYPTTEQGLDVLPLKTRNDPWGRPYIYTIPGREEPFDVMSLGADGREGGTEGTADADIGSWQLGDASTTGASP